MISFAVSFIMNFRKTGLEFLLFDKATDVSIGAAPPYYYELPKLMFVLCDGCF